MNTTPVCPSAPTAPPAAVHRSYHSLMRDGSEFFARVSVSARGLWRQLESTAVRHLHPGHAWAGLIRAHLRAREKELPGAILGAHAARSTTLRLSPLVMGILCARRGTDSRRSGRGGRSLHGTGILERMLVHEGAVIGPPRPHIALLRQQRLRGGVATTMTEQRRRLGVGCGTMSGHAAKVASRAYRRKGPSRQSVGSPQYILPNERTVMHAAGFRKWTEARNRIEPASHGALRKRARRNRITPVWHSDMSKMLAHRVALAITVVIRVRA